MSAWKPGDVAMVTAQWKRDADHEPRAASRYSDGWQAIDGGAYAFNSDVSAIRPLVVIDPESEDDVRRLCEAYRSVDHGVGITPMQAALREFANPKPQIEEPGKYGAVIAGDGREWIRYTTSERSGRDWVRAGTDGGTAYARWDDLEVVRVVSEGVR